MEVRNAAFRVGLLIVAGIALTVAFVWFFSGRTIRHAGVYESYFTESVQGLDTGSAVRYRGVALGRVTELGLAIAEYGVALQGAPDIAHYGQVFVRYELDLARLGRAPDVASAVKLGLRARLAQQGVTGLSYIELDFVDPERYPPQRLAWQPKDAYIPTMPSTLTQVQDAAQQVLAKLNTVDIAALAASLTQLAQDLHRELDTGDVHQALAQTQELLRATRDAVQAADLPGLSGDLRRTVTAVRDTVQGKDMQLLLASGAQSADRLARAAAQLPALLAALQATASRADTTTADLERELPPLLRDLQAAAQNLQEITDALRSAPAQLLLAAPPPRATQEQK